MTFEFPNKYFVMHGEKAIDVEESKFNKLVLVSNIV